MKASLFINPSRESIDRALESWHWLPVKNREPVLVTAFGDIFFEDDDGIWFLDTLEGAIQRVCDSRADLDALLASTDGEDRYCLAGFVERAHREGMKLMNDQCYNFKLHPVLGGKTEFSNIKPMDFVVAINIAGQLHEQVRKFPPRAKISRLVLEE